jgi:hypothetical protein
LTSGDRHSATDLNSKVSGLEGLTVGRGDLFRSNGTIARVLWTENRVGDKKLTVLDVRLSGLVDGNTEEDALSHVSRVSVEVNFTRTRDAVQRNCVPFSYVNHPWTVLNDDCVWDVLVPCAVQLCGVYCAVN